MPDDEPQFGEDYFDSLEPALPVLTHPLRYRAYVEAVKAPVSAKDLAERLDVPLPRMSYHVRLLAEANLLKVVSRTPRRGAVETHYRAVATFEFDQAAVESSSSETQQIAYEAQIGLIAEDLCHAVGGGIRLDPELFLTRAHFVVDDAGRERLAKELRDFYARLAELEEELRVDPGPDVHELNVVLCSYPAPRAGGRNGPMVVNLPETETIPPY